MNLCDVHRGENSRILFFFWILAAAVLVLLIGLAWQQIFVDNEYRNIEKKQTQRRILLPGPRGDITDRNGKLLVGNRPHFSAVVYLDDLRHEFRLKYSELLKSSRENNPNDIEIDKNQLQWDARQAVIERYLELINSITGREDKVSRRKLIQHFNEKKILPMPLAGDLTPTEYARLAEQVPVQSPLKIYTDTARFYPYKEAAAQTLGYVIRTDPDLTNLPNDKLKTYTFKTKRGETGLEKTFDTYLKGESGMELWLVDPQGFQNTRLNLTAPKQGKTLITSIDIDLQIAAETALGKRTGAVVSLDVNTGEVLSIVSHPTYNMNDLSPIIYRKVFQDINERGAWLNRTIQLSYPPGSTFKLITSITGMLNGTIPDDTLHNCEGAYYIGDREFKCHSHFGHGPTDLVHALEVSCNIFYYTEGLELGIDLLSKQAKRFGLNKITGIEIPYETKRIIVPDKEWKKQSGRGRWFAGETALTSIGQGFLLVTPLQMATVIASIARGETRTKPTMLAHTPDKSMQINHNSEKIGLSQIDWMRLLEGMQRVVGPEGTGRLVQIDNFLIAGKTGTSDFRAHGKDVNLAWFVGFAPVENPQIAVAVMVEGTDINDRYHGGSTAGPVARDIFLKFIEKYPERAGYP